MTPSSDLYIYYNFIIHNLMKIPATVSVRNKVTLCEPISEAESISSRESVTNHTRKISKIFQNTNDYDQQKRLAGSELPRKGYRKR